MIQLTVFTTASGSSYAFTRSRGAGQPVDSGTLYCLTGRYAGHVEEDIHLSARRGARARGYRDGRTIVTTTRVTECGEVFLSDEQALMLGGRVGILGFEASLTIPDGVVLGEN